MILPLNGQLWESPSMLRARSQYLGNGIWVLLGMRTASRHGGYCRITMSDPEGNGQILYTQEQLGKRLVGWKLIQEN